MHIFIETRKITFWRWRITNGTNVKEKYSGNVFLNVEYVAFALCAKHEAASGCKIEHGITGILVLIL